MKKYKCPYCENDTFSFFQKMTAGGMASKGKACPKCGKHAVHGFQSTIFRTILLGVVLVFFIINYKFEFIDPYICLIIFIIAYLICMLANGFYFELTENNRRDIR